MFWDVDITVNVEAETQQEAWNRVQALAWRAFSGEEDVQLDSVGEPEAEAE